MTARAANSTRETLPRTKRRLRILHLRVVYQSGIYQTDTNNGSRTYANNYAQLWEKQLKQLSNDKCLCIQ